MLQLCSWFRFPVLFTFTCPFKHLAFSLHHRVRVLVDVIGENDGANAGFVRDGFGVPVIALRPSEQKLVGWVLGVYVRTTHR